MFGAIYGWSMKASFALSFVLIGFFLSGIGFDPGLEAQTTGTYLNMRLAMCIGAAGPALLCFVLLKFYPLNREKSEENRKKLEAMRGDN